MTIVVCGAEGEWALFSNTLSLTGADTKRRGSVVLSFGEQMFKDWSPAASRDMWIHSRFAGVDVSSNAISPKTFFRIADTNGNDMFRFTPASLSTVPIWDLQIQTVNSSGGSTFTTDAERYSADNLAFVEWDIRLQITTDSNSDDTLTVTVYRNSQLRYTRTIVDSGGWALPGQIRLSEKDNNGSRDHERMYYQDFIVTDGVPTVGMELAVLIPSAVGQYTDFSNDYTNIDDNGYDPSTVITTNATNQRESWIFATPTFVLGDKVIYGVAMDTVAQTDLGAIVSDFQPFLRITATDYAGANLGANNINPDSFVTLYQTNPSTGQPWAQADLSALEAGLRSV